jgi:hypothetical protein
VAWWWNLAGPAILVAGWYTVAFLLWIGAAAWRGVRDEWRRVRQPKRGLRPVD